MNVMQKANTMRARPIATGNPKATMYAALAKARGEFPTIPKTRKATVRMKSGGSYSYMYADLADVFNAVDPVLAAYGFAVIQYPEKDSLITELLHESGERIRASHPIHVNRDGKSHPAQEWAAGLTFAKRYALTALLGVATEESIEGDDSRRITPHGGADVSVSADFTTKEGLGIGVKNVVVDPKDPPDVKARKFADGIIAEMQNSKTARGLNGAWNRHDRFIERFNSDYPDLYREVFDAFHAHMESFDDETQAEDPG